LEAQRLAAAEAAWLAAKAAAARAVPACSGYGCVMKWQADQAAQRMAAQPLHVRGYGYALQVIAYAQYQAQVKQYQAENYAYARMGTTREAEAQRIYQEKLAIHHQWVAEQTSIEAERAQLLFYDTARLTGTVLSDPSTATHLVLDVLGMIPVIGEPADGLNALIYLAEGDELNAGLSAAGMIPIGGMAVTGVRAVKTAVSAGMDAVRMVDATSSAISMAVKLDPPTIKPVTGATTPPAAPVAAAVPPAPKPADGGVPISEGVAPIRGLSQYGGVVSEQGTNAAGGRVVTSSGPISQDDFAGFVNSGVMRGDDVHVLTGVHGAPDGSMVPDVTLYADDVARFGDLDGVTIHDVATMSPAAITEVLESPGTIIGGFCDSAVCLAPFM
jgi:hypothetical protein